MFRESGSLIPRHEPQWQLGVAHQRYQERYTEFERLAVPHVDFLYAYAIRLVGNREDAKAILQETFLKAYGHWENLNPGSDVRAWLSRILRNAYVNFCRRVLSETPAAGVGVEASRLHAVCAVQEAG